jgi:hypothetical protein
MRNIITSQPVAPRPVAPQPVASLVASLMVATLVVASVAIAAVVASAASVRAETKIFFVENQPDGYGIDQCLASGAKCGRPMASAYCQSRQYGGAASFRKVDPEEIAANRAGTDVACRASGCVDFVAIECVR